MTTVIDHGHFKLIYFVHAGADMTQHVSKSQFKARALEYFRQVETSGEPIIVTDHGKPTLEIRPVTQELKRDPMEMLKGSVIWYDESTDPVDVDDWEALK